MMPNLKPALVPAIDWLRQVAPTAQLSSDTRSVNSGDVYFAYTNAQQFILDAIERGAAAILYDENTLQWDDAWEVPHHAVPDLKAHAGFIANAFYAQPDAVMRVVAVTGTNGKTSCTQWLGNALSRLGQPTAVIGTLGVGVYRRGEAGAFDVTGYTTPDAVLLQRHLAQLRDSGAAALAIEASSIGLDQGRLHGLHCDIALHTNFTRDHLDYHGDMATYEAAKTRLFVWPGLRHAVINLDDAMGLRLVQHVQKHAPAVAIIGYSVTGQTLPGIRMLQASDIRSSHIGTSCHVHAWCGQSLLKTQLVGHFNVSNVLGILGVLLAQETPWRKALDAIEALTAVPGRMQQLGGHDAPLVVIDYAHTPDALEKTLAVLRQVATERGGQLWCVFGCGGDRDNGKRAGMGAVAEFSDHVIVTSDNPRSETPEHIITQILAGMKVPGQVVVDRAAAILSAIKHAEKRDVILLAGKGHESTQEIKGKKLPFLDADHAALALAARPAMKGAH